MVKSTLIFIVCNNAKLDDIVVDVLECHLNLLKKCLLKFLKNEMSC